MVISPTLTELLVACSGLGMMPLKTSLVGGIPQISNIPAEARTTVATTLTGGGMPQAAAAHRRGTPWRP